jgi:hypothetical protein
LSQEFINELKTLLSSFQAEMDQLLFNNKIYDILNYGWLDHDTPDPEHFGHFIWQTEPPFEHDWGAFFNEDKVPYSPTKRDETFLRNGEDFAGSMIFARRSLGMALCYAEMLPPENLMSNDAEFWHECSNALLWLNIASDRLREYLLMAAFGQLEKQYAKKYRQQHPDQNPRIPYSEPFRQALDQSSDELRELLRKLLALSMVIQDHRKRRNNLVHEVATRTAERSLEILRQQRAEAKRGQSLAPNNDSHSYHLHITDDATQRVAALERVKQWYKTLVDASSLVFEFEYFSRPGRATNSGSF